MVSDQHLVVGRLHCLVKNSKYDPSLIFFWQLRATLALA